MSWIKVWLDCEINDQTQSTFDYKALTLDQNCTQVFEAECDSIATTSVDATMASAGSVAIPSYGVFYEIGSGNFGFLVNQIIAKRRSDSPFIFDVQVTYNRKISFQPEGQEKWAVSISIGGQEYTQDAYIDKDGHPIQNSAGSPFDPTLKETFNDLKIAVKYKTLDPPDLDGLLGRVNSSTVTFDIQGFSKSYDARQLKLKEGDISTTYTDGSEDNNPVWDVSLVFLGREDKYLNTVVDQGYGQRTSSVASPNLCGGGGGGPPGGTYVEITDTFHHPISAPARLDGHGQLLNAGGGAAVYLCFPIEKEADLSGLFSGLS